MTVATREIGLEGLDGLEAESLCLFVCSDERPLAGAPGFADWRLNGGLSRRLLEGFFTGTFKELLLLPSHGLIPCQRIFAVGAGPLKALDADRLKELLELAAGTLKKAGAESVALSLPPTPSLDDATRAELVREHFLKGYGHRGVTVLAERGLKAALSG